MNGRGIMVEKRAGKGNVSRAEIAGKIVFWKKNHRGEIEKCRKIWMIHLFLVTLQAKLEMFFEILIVQVKDFA